MKFKKRIGSSLSIIEVFGSAFALLIVIFLILNMLSEAKIQKRLENSIEEGSYKISWQNKGEGFIVIAFPEKLLIIEKAKNVNTNQLCEANSPFVKYAKEKYKSQKKQIIFAIVQGGVATMKVARDCLMTTFPKKAISVGWIIANDELLKAVSIDQIPAHIKKAIQ
jgi:hypothetical protein